MSTDVLVSFDTTGSMSPCIAEVRRRVTEALNKLFDNIPDLRVGIISHGDWCDGHKAITSIGFTSDRQLLSDFIRTAPNTSGGDSDEFYEYVLYLAGQFSWQADRRIMLLIADANPHPVNYYRHKPEVYDWQAEAVNLGKIGVAIYAVQALNNRGATNFYESLSRLTNGRKLNLNQFTDAVETIIAICYHSQGRLDEYQNELQGEFRMNRNLANMFDQLANRRVAVVSGTDTSGLVPVHPARFQVVHVDRTTDIKSFVNSIGADFKVGRGFYEFTKPEEIQERKEVILRNRSTGDLFTGPEAREYIGLPYGRRGHIRPGDFASYEVYVQSTSANRKLIGGTKFLYEVEGL